MISNDNNQDSQRVNIMDELRNIQEEQVEDPEVKDELKLRISPYIEQQNEQLNKKESQINNGSKKKQQSNKTGKQMFSINSDQVEKVKDNLKGQLIDYIVGNICEHVRYSIDEALGFVSRCNKAKATIQPDEIINKCIQFKNRFTPSCFDRFTCGLFYDGGRSRYKRKLEIVERYDRAIKFLQEFKKNNNKNYDICSIETMKNMVSSVIDGKK